MGLLIFLESPNVGTNPADGAIFLDVNANPTNPHYLGNWNENYIHDGMVRGEGCGLDVYVGELFAVDVSNKSNPVTLGSYPTPNNLLITYGFLMMGILFSQLMKLQMHILRHMMFQI